MPTLLEYAKLAESVYQRFPSAPDGWRCPDSNHSVDAYAFWRLGNPLKSGFQGRVFQRSLPNGEIVIGFKGTDPTMMHDLTSDVRLTLGWSLRQASDALAAVEAWLPDYPNVPVSLVGHSLGGALAQLVGRSTGLPFVTFQAPGVAGVHLRWSPLNRSGNPNGVNVRVARGMVTDVGVPIGRVIELDGGPDSHSIKKTRQFLEGAGSQYGGRRVLGS